jgi:hypothetical protein
VTNHASRRRRVVLGIVGFVGLLIINVIGSAVFNIVSDIIENIAGFDVVYYVGVVMFIGVFGIAMLRAVVRGGAGLRARLARRRLLVTKSVMPKSVP